MNGQRWRALVAAAFLIVGVSADAAELRVSGTVAVKAVMDELIPQFERASGHKVVIPVRYHRRSEEATRRGDAFDIAIFTPPELIDELIKQGKIATGTRADFARTEVGVAVRAGAPKPDDTVETGKATLLTAKSLGYTDPALRWNIWHLSQGVNRIVLEWLMT